MPKVNGVETTKIIARASDGTTAEYTLEDAVQEQADNIYDIMYGRMDEYRNDELTVLTSNLFYAFLPQNDSGSVSYPYQVYFPNLTQVKNKGFSSSILKRGRFPKLKTITSDTFASCYELIDIEIPSVTAIPNGGFYGCKKLPKLDLVSCTSIGASALRECNALSLIVLRSETMCTYANTNVSQDPVNANLKILVPRSLVESYKGATNWSRLADKFYALEDYTVDGTITGTLIDDV